MLLTRLLLGLYQAPTRILLGSMRHLQGSYKAFTGMLYGLYKFSTGLQREFYEISTGHL